MQMRLCPIMPVSLIDLLNWRPMHCSLLVTIEGIWYGAQGRQVLVVMDAMGPCMGFVERFTIYQGRLVAMWYMGKPWSQLSACSA